jgi:hypothetical protein
MDRPALSRFSASFKVVFVPFLPFLLFCSVGVECSAGGAVECPDGSDFLPFFYFPPGVRSA